VTLSTHHIDYLIRRFDPAPLTTVVQATVAPPLARRMWHVRGVGRLRTGDAAGESGIATAGGADGAAGDASGGIYLMRDALIGVYGYKIPVAFLLRGDMAGTTVEAGVWSPVGREQLSPGALDARVGVLGSVLASLFPGIDLAPADPVTPIFPLAGLVLGQPSRKPMSTPDASCPLDRLIRAMTSSSWAALILAEPVDESVVSDLRNAVLNELRAIEGEAQSQAAPGPLAQLYEQLLGSHVADYTFGHTEGAWRTAVYLLGDRTSYYRLSAAWRTAFAGDESVAEPIRVVQDGLAGTLARDWALPDVDAAPGPGLFRHPFGYQTLLTSSQLAAYLQLPRRETSGFAVRLIPSFDCVPSVIADQESIALGPIIERDRPTAAEYEVGRSMLTRHALVTGVTGSGKTNTVMHVLDQLWRCDVPFLVLEPAKTEYRALLAHPTIGAALRVFTAGNEVLSPLRLNPFEFEPGTSLSTHIDLLRSVFDVSFGMWSPLPQVLEQCLHTVYSNCGWEPARTENQRLDDPDHRDPWAFPTLTQLYRQVEETVGRLGYDERVSSDIRAALLTRLNSLRVGAKGMMLDTDRSIPLTELLRLPTIIELEAIGDDDEKAFVMGLLMIRLYENLRGRGVIEGGGLRHLTVIEEAHRLLPDIPVTANPEQANMRGKAVETFVSMLAEVRAYGEGLLVAEQIPRKLAPDVLKNTNLKVVHRMVADDDRHAVGWTMNMDSAQLEMLSILRTGQAAVFSEGDDRPILVHVPYVKLTPEAGAATRTGSDARVATRMDPFRRADAMADAFVPHPLCDQVCGQPYAFCDRVKPLVESPRLREHFSCLPLTCVLTPAALPARVEDLLTFLRGALPAAALRREAFRCAVQNACRWYVTHFGREYDWSFWTTHRIYDGLSRLLLHELGADIDGPPLAVIQSALAQEYHAACGRGPQPFPACTTLCPSGECLFRHQASMLVDDRPLTEAFDLTMARAGVVGRWEDVAPIRDVVRRLQATDLPAEHRRSLGLCFGVQRIAALPGLLTSARQLATEDLVSGYDASTAPSPPEAGHD
jgi:hypothetical protein